MVDYNKPVERITHKLIRTIIKDGNRTIKYMPWIEELNEIAQTIRKEWYSDDQLQTLSNVAEYQYDIEGRKISEKKSFYYSKERIETNTFPPPLR